jgi:5'-3' exonuclease
MGIKGLSRFIRERTNAISQIHISQFSNKKIALDVSNYYYKYKAIYKHQAIMAFYSMLRSFRKNIVHCIFVFDGKPPVEKSETLRKREQQRISIQDRAIIIRNAIEAYDKYVTGDRTIDVNTFVPVLEIFNSDTKLAEIINDPVELIDIDKAREKLSKLESENIRITPSDIEDLKQLITKVGARYIQASGETEPLCYSLFRENKIDAVISEDSDLLAYGVKKLILGYSMDGSCSLVNLDVILNDLELTQQQFLDFCILSGTDYNSNIPKIGPVTAYKLIREYETIEAIQQAIGKAPEKFERSRELFKTIPEAVDIEYWDVRCDSSLTLFAFENGIREDVESVFSPTKVIFEEEQDDHVELP